MTENCPICDKRINKKCKVIFCNNCYKSVHTKCNSLSSSDIKSISRCSNKTWICCNCTSKLFPFDAEFSSSSSKPDPSFISHANLIASLSSDDNDETLFGEINCKYYTPIEFLSNFSTASAFSAFHLNIVSLTKHFDELGELLVSLGHEFGVIGISETRILKESPSATSFDIPNYSAIHIPTEGSAGGVSMFVSNRNNFKQRPDLDSLCYCPKILESVFVEIFHNKKKCTIVGTIYRHPSLPMEEFNSIYLAPLLMGPGV
jgi:hypothetical protein